MYEFPTRSTSCGQTDKFSHPAHVEYPRLTCVCYVIAAATSNLHLYNGTCYKWIKTMQHTQNITWTWQDEIAPCVSIMLDTWSSASPCTC
jgi:hypothetical protein